MVVQRVYIVRHGETDANREGIIQGHLDTTLNDVGREQAAQVADALKEVPFDVAYASDLSRASETARAIVKHHPSVELCLSDTIRERSFGDLQGHKMSPGKLPHNVENAAVFAKRAVDFWNRAIVQGGHNLTGIRNVLVVSHGGWIGTLLQTLVASRKLTLDKDVVLGQCFNASITVVETGEDGKGHCVSFGSVYHLVDNAVDGNVDVVEE